MADLRGGGRLPCAPHGPNFFQFYAVFRKFGKIVCWRPPGGLAPPPTGNPRSALYSNGYTEVWVHSHLRLSELLREPNRSTLGSVSSSDCMKCLKLFRSSPGHINFRSASLLSSNTFHGHRIITYTHLNSLKPLIHQCFLGDEPILSVIQLVTIDTMLNNNRMNIDDGLNFVTCE